LQTYCSKPACQKARKALWQKQKVATDPEYKKDQHLSQEKWLSANPDYYKNYLRRNPEKADRNRALQRIRNHKVQLAKTICIAKMDARNASNQSLLGQFWLVPTIAKMDPVKVFITTAPGCSP
jgi:hypothetical protein